MPIRWRLTIWYGLALASLLGLFCFAIYWLSRGALLKSFDAGLMKNLGVIQGELSEEISEEQTASVQQPVASGTSAAELLRRAAKAALSELRLSDVSVEIRLGGRGETLLARSLADPSNSDLNRVLARARVALARASPFPVLPGYRGVLGHIRSVAGSGPVTFVLVGSTETVQRSLVAIRDSLLTLSLLGLGLALGGGYVISYRLLRPIDSLGRQAWLLAESRRDHSHRLHVANEADELGRLVAAFNRLLQQLDASLLQIKRFVGDAAHQLRTPVSIVRGEAELALTRQRSASDYRESLETIAGESVHLSRLVRDLTLLTEVESAETPIESRLVDLDEMLIDTVRALRSLAERRQARIEVKGGRGIQCSGDERLIREILLNLIENAIKFSREGSLVSIEVSSRASATVIRVSDGATTIPESERERVFERFYRGAAARCEGIEGSGLGLAIVRWAAERHGGSVRVEPAAPSGNVFLVELPTPPAPVRADSRAS